MDEKKYLKEILSEISHDANANICALELFISMFSECEEKEREEFLESIEISLKLLKLNIKTLSYLKKEDYPQQVFVAKDEIIEKCKSFEKISSEKKIKFIFIENIENDRRIIQTEKESFLFFIDYILLFLTRNSAVSSEISVEIDNYSFSFLYLPTVNPKYYSPKIKFIADFANKLDLVMSIKYIENKIKLEFSHK